jgi:antitoxin component of MazEF toxin-antitoxin module
MSDTIPNHTIQRIMSSWSRTLEIEQSNGESIVTQRDVERVIRVLSNHVEQTERSHSTCAMQTFPTNCPKRE